MFGMVPFDYNNHNWFDAFDNFEKNFFGNSNVDLPDFRDRKSTRLNSSHP